MVCCQRYGLGFSEEKQIIRSALWIIDINDTDTADTGRNPCQSIRAIIKYINFPAVELPFQLYNRCWYIPAAVLYVILRIFIDTRNITCYNKYMIRKGDT